MNHRFFPALALILCLAFPASAAQTRTVYHLEEGSDFLEQMTTASLEELCSIPRDVTGDYLAQQRGYGFSIDLTGISAEEARDLILAAGPDWLAVTAPEPEGQPISLKDGGFATLDQAREAGYSRFYLDTLGFWGLDAGWLPIESTEKLRDPAMASGMLEYYVNPAYLYRNYLAPGAELDRWQGEFLGFIPEDTAPGEPDIRITGPDQLVLFTAVPTTPSALAVKLSAIRTEAEGEWGPYLARTLDSGEILLTANSRYPGSRAAGYPEEIFCIPAP